MTGPARKQTTRTSAVDTVTADKPTADKPTADKPESTAAKVSRSAPLDLTALSVEAAPAPKIKGNPAAGRKKADNSVAEKWIQDSWDARKDGEKMGAGKAVTIPTAALGTLKSRLNTAAATLKLGVTIQSLVNGDTDSAGNKVSLPEGQTRVVFAAKVRKQKAAKPAAAAPAADAAK